MAVLTPLAALFSNRRQRLHRPHCLPFPPRTLQRPGNGRQIFEETASTNPIQIPARGDPVNKTELIEHIAKHADISKAAATRALESMIGKALDAPF